MPRLLQSTEAAGNPTATPFEVAVNALFAPLLTSVVWAFNVILTDKFPATTRFFRLMLDSEPLGVTMTNPYQLKVFEAYDDDTALAMVRSFTALNPAWFYAPLIYRYSDQLFGQSTRTSILLVYNEDGVGGAANWLPAVSAITTTTETTTSTSTSSTTTTAAPVMDVTWDPTLTYGGDVVFSNGNKTFTGVLGRHIVRATLGKTSGKWFYEITVTAETINSASGLWPVGAPQNDYLGDSFAPFSFGRYQGAWYVGMGPNNIGSSPSDGTIQGFLVDLDAGTIGLYSDGILIAGGLPLPAWTPGSTWFPASGRVDAACVCVLNCGPLSAGGQAAAAAGGANPGWY